MKKGIILFLWAFVCVPVLIIIIANVIPDDSSFTIKSIFSYVFIGLIFSMIPSVIFAIYYETKDARMNHYKKCRCTCGLCCKMPKPKESKIE